MPSGGSTARLLFFLLLFLFEWNNNPFVAFAEPRNDEVITPLIIGGEQVRPGDHPYFVTIIVSDAEGSYLCGGSLIGPDVVLSGAHCDRTNASRTVIVGSYGFLTAEGGGQLRRCVKWVNDPKHRTGEHDFALCKLDHPVDVDVDDNVVRLELNVDDSVPIDGEDLIVMGFGYVDFANKAHPEFLRSLEEPYIGTERCNAEDVYDGRISDVMLCAGFLEGGKGQCLGDSGGPLVRRTIRNDGTIVDTQVGIVSWSSKNNATDSGCALRNLPGVFARISSRVDWIKKTACDDLNSIAPFCNSNNNNNNNPSRRSKKTKAKISKTAKRKKNTKRRRI